jgi:hypothetical protein
MAEIKRITPEEVLEAYEKTGLKPKQCSFRIRDGKCCAVTVLVKAAGFNSSEELREERAFSEEYFWGFVFGFDGRTGHDPKGGKDGQAAWEAVKHLAVVE